MDRLFRIFFISIIYISFYIPTIIFVINSFNSSKFGIIWKGFTINWYNLLIKNDSLLQAFKNSLIIAFLSSTIATLIGFLTSVSLYFYRFKGKLFFMGILYTMMMSPDIIIAISLLILFIIFKIPLGFWSLLLSHIILCLPFVIVTIFSNFKRFDVRILEAAKDLGASEITVLYKVIFPLAMSSILAGWILSFTLSIDDVIVSSFVTGPGYEVLPLKIYSMIKVGISPEINALATVLLMLSLTLVIVSQLIKHPSIK